jgi:hypothetical protein
MARGGFRQVPHLAVEALALCCCSGPAAEELFFGSSPITPTAPTSIKRAAQ